MSKNCHEGAGSARLRFPGRQQQGMLATGGESTSGPFHLQCPRRALGCGGARCTASNVAGKLWMLTKQFLTEPQQTNIGVSGGFASPAPSCEPFRDFGGNRAILQIVARLQ